MPSNTPAEGYWFLLDSWKLSLRSQNRSPKTIQSYTEAAKALGEFLAGRGHSLVLAEIKRGDVEAFVDAVLHQVNARTGEICKPATAANRYRSLQQWFRWLVEVEGEIERSPMVGMQAPHLPESLPPVLSVDQVKKILAVCEKATDFQSKRDYAILMILLDCGLRRSEIAGLAVTDADFDADPPTLQVVGKGGKKRRVALGYKAVLALRRYLRARLEHADSGTSALWLGRNGPTTHWLIRDVVERLAEKAGVEGVHAHRWRHTWAHLCKVHGAQRSELADQGGWSPNSPMPEVYGRSAASEQARGAHRKFSPGDHL